jgi:hypothetical protein
MGKFSRKFKNRILKEQKKAMNRIYKKQGIEGLQRLMSGADYYGTKEDKEFIGTLDVAEQEGTEVQGPEEGTEQEVVPAESEP